MKNYLILAMILVTGFSAYPQATRSARESSSDKGAKKEAVRSNERSESRKSVTRSESKQSAPRSESRQSVNRSESKQSVNRSESRQSQGRTESSREKVENRSQDRPQGTRSSEQSSRTRVENRSSEKQEATRQSNEAVRRGSDQDRTKSGNDQRYESRDNRRVETGTNRSGNGDGATRVMREGNDPDDRDFRVNNSAAKRIYREEKGALTLDGGKVIRHNNDEVFSSRRYKLDFDNYQNLRRSDDFRRGYREYDHWYRHRHVRVVHHYHNTYIPVPWDVRRVRYYHRVPHHIDLIWTPLLFHRFMYYYPTQNYWDMEFGSRIETISAYEAREYAGTVRRVYGKVDEVYYSPEDENYILYIGAPFPYHDISVVIPRHIARDISRSPKWYFEDEYVWIVGLINMWEGKPEIVVRDEDQIRKY
jgi:hypothetical protein